MRAGQDGRTGYWIGPAQDTSFENFGTRNGLKTLLIDFYPRPRGTNVSDSGIGGKKVGISGRRKLTNFRKTEK